MEYRQSKSKNLLGLSNVIGDKDAYGRMCLEGSEVCAYCCGSRLIQRESIFARSC